MAMQNAFRIFLQTIRAHLIIEPVPKSPINWILSGVEGCKHLLIMTLRLRSVSGLPLICLFGVDSILNRKSYIVIIPV